MAQNDHRKQNTKKTKKNEKKNGSIDFHVDENGMNTIKHTRA